MVRLCAPRKTRISNILVPYCGCLRVVGAEGGREREGGKMSAGRGGEEHGVSKLGVGERGEQHVLAGSCPAEQYVEIMFTGRRTMGV